MNNPSAFPLGEPNDGFAQYFDGQTVPMMGIGGVSSLPQHRRGGAIRRCFEEALRDMEKNRVHFVFFGDLSRLSPELQELCRNAEARSREYHEVQVNFCLNYGGRDEILRAARRFAQAVANGEQEPDQLDESLFSRYLYSAGVPDPELIIRPSGEKRTSNFLLWQSAYSEYVVQDVLWPDYSPRALAAAIAEFHRRNRRFGGA